jgi:hypothetical protein
VAKEPMTESDILYISFEMKTSNKARLFSGLATTAMHHFHQLKIVKLMLDTI